MVRLSAPTYELNADRILRNPSQEDLHRYASEMPNARRTEFGNYNVRARVDARSTASTYIVSDDPSETSSQTISREEARRIARLQDEYIAKQEMLVIDGWIGSDPDFRVAARLVIEKANANIAGMQQYLYYTDDLPS
ncbi:MAG: phosphoenolpyruvate carboxykinase (ATP), partial [Dehalococcoidia bacterium]